MVGFVYCVLPLKAPARSVSTHVGWQVTLLMSAFFRGESTTGLERFSASAHWHEISAVTPRREGGDSIKNSADTCRRQLVLRGKHQQSHFQRMAFQCHLFCLLYLVLHFPFLPSFQVNLIKKCFNANIYTSSKIKIFPFHSLHVRVFNFVYLLFWWDSFLIFLSGLLVDMVHNK